MTWFLVILFLMADGSLGMKEGWYPLEQPNLEVCGESVERVISYLSSVDAVAIAFCKSMLIEGRAV